MSRQQEAPVSDISMIDLELAKNVFQVRGADASGQVVQRKQHWNSQVVELFGSQTRSPVTMEA